MRARKLRARVKITGAASREFGYDVKLAEGAEIDDALHEALKVIATRCAVLSDPGWVARVCGYLVSDDVGDRVAAVLDEADTPPPALLAVGDAFRVGT